MNEVLASDFFQMKKEYMVKLDKYLQVSNPEDLKV